MSAEFELLMFSTDPATIKSAVPAGVDGIVVDWENIGKRSRQNGADTQINYDSFDDLIRVRSSTDAPVICRVNSFPHLSCEEIDQAVDGGADEILLPMVRTVDEVDRVFEWIDGRCRLGILIETMEAVQIAEALYQLPLSRVYVGLNDLAIQRGFQNIFLSVADGTVARLKESCPVPFGFAGLTMPDCGYPIPCRLLMAEMVRLNCQFSLLRRSYFRDADKKAHRDCIIKIRETMDNLGDLSRDQLIELNSELVHKISRLTSSPNDC